MYMIVALCKWINPCGFAQQFTEYLRGLSRSCSKPNSYRLCHNLLNKKTIFTK